MFLREDPTQCILIAVNQSCESWHPCVHHELTRGRVVIRFICNSGVRYEGALVAQNRVENTDRDRYTAISSVMVASGGSDRVVSQRVLFATRARLGLASSWDRDQQATAYPNRVLMPSREAVIVARFEEPAKSML